MPPAIRVAYFYVTFTLACFVSNISTQNAQTPAISNQSSNVLVEKNATTRTVLTMIASSSFVSVMNMRNASKQSAGSANIRAMFSIVPHDVCLAKRLHCDDSITQFQIVNQTADNFYVESVLTSNEDLNTICTPKEKHDHISFIFYPGHAVFPEGTQTFKSYQVWYKCGLFEPEDYGKKSAEGRGILRSISKMLKCLGYMVMTIAILAVIVQLCRLSYR
uniref:Major sperm protein n=1 Tax=Caenorhabditis japonica TaxID=281687 RepID=A0A8R1DLG8_CAEJA